jgi:hypothetical protein
VFSVQKTETTPRGPLKEAAPPFDAFAVPFVEYGPGLFVIARPSSRKTPGMRKTPLAAGVCLLFAFAFPARTHAQFLKNVINAAKPKSAASSNSSQSSGQNAGDSAAVMKSLGMVVSGGGVSAADSAAAIRSYKTAHGGNGLFYQYQMVTTSKQKGKTTILTDTSSSSITDAGEGRREMRLPIPGAGGGKLTVIGHVSSPQYSIIVYPDTKTWALNIIDTALLNTRETYKIQVIGNETVQGYPCIHVKMTTTIGAGLFKSSSIMDLWTSTAVPGYSLYKSLLANANMKYQMLRSLQDAGAAGFIVRMDASGKDYSMTMSLLRAERQSFPASEFVIPAGYAQSDENMMGHIMNSAAKQQQQ